MRLKEFHETIDQDAALDIDQSLQIDVLPLLIDLRRQIVEVGEAEAVHGVREFARALQDSQGKLTAYAVYLRNYTGGRKNTGRAGRKHKGIYSTNYLVATA